MSSLCAPSNQSKNVSIPYRQSRDLLEGFLVLPFGLFQFLIGSLEMRCLQGFMDRMLGVSIPYRQSRDFTRSTFPVRAWQVSIPYRQSRDSQTSAARGPRKRFQFLIGSLEIWRIRTGEPDMTKFQFLIGSLEIECLSIPFPSVLEFQFLIGSLEIQGYRHRG